MNYSGRFPVSLPGPTLERSMRLLIVGAGGVGSAAAAIAARRQFFDACVVADHDPARAARAVAGADRRFVAARVDAADPAAVTALCAEHGITHVLNAVDPRFVLPVFDGAFAAGAHYLDMAMSLSRPHATNPYADRRAAHAAQAWPGLHHPAHGGRGPRLAARRGRRLPARPGHHRRQDARQDLRRHLGPRHGC